jgi:SpoVK/Ycf46/Vps4 family AAA+-type ATPase
MLPRMNIPPDVSRFQGHHGNKGAVHGIKGGRPRLDLTDEERAERLRKQQETYRRIQTAEAIAPCVLWIDEIEKGFSGSKSSGGSDGGTSSRVFGSLLSWMQEKEKPVFVVASANDVSQLPPEFLRKGRFDELFFVDLPDAVERSQIWEIVITRHGRHSSSFDTTALAKSAEQYTGAEIDAIFVDALYDAFLENGREPTDLDLVNAMTRMVPLANLMDGR